MGELKTDKGLKTFQGWFKDDSAHLSDWREDAREDYRFVDGDQWDKSDKEKLKKENRPVMTFNRAQTLINAVSGSEISNRMETRFIPREEGDAKPNELLTAAAEWARDNADSEDEQSEAFRDAAICGLGWTDTRIDYDEDQDGMIVEDRISPFEMGYDYAARKKNLKDSRRFYRIRVDMPIDEARELFPDASDSELDGSWAKAYIDNPDIEETQKNNEEGECKHVTLVHYVWYERQPFYRLKDPLTGQEAELDPGQYETLNKRLGGMLQGVKQTKRVYKEAWIGGVVLEQGDSDCQSQFRYQCITGVRDEENGTFYGLLRLIKDPQRYANKFFSQTLNIMDKSAKGGIMVEEGALAGKFEDFKESWARHDSVTEVPHGALSGQYPKIKEKPVAAFPAGQWQLMEFAINSIRDTSGINQELLGQREANQPGVLEYQRRQAGMTILQWLFDSLRRFRKRQGRVMLHYLQEYISDGRLIRVVGESGAQYVPLMRQASATYDVIVDEAPSSPNQKEKVWSLVGPMFMQLPPQIQIELLEYSPFPDSVVEKVKKAMQALMEPPEPGPEEQLGQAKAEADIEKTRSEADKNHAQVQETLANLMVPTLPVM
jgi:hypothetical protein